tara:strand:- start:300 stop:794 length:495 start_codon:yes stop_codon:yes gene_type:complete
MENYIIHKCDYLMSEIEYTKTTKLAVTWIAVHGITDILNDDSLFIVIHVYMVSIMIVYFLNTTLRFILLIIISIYHIRKDIGIIGSVILHISWFFKPNITLPYLSIVHVPLHYYRVMIDINIYKLCLLNMSVPILYIFIPDSIYMACRSFMWVGPVLGHIMLIK